MREKQREKRERERNRERGRERALELCPESQPLGRRVRGHLIGFMSIKLRKMIVRQKKLIIQIPRETNLLENISCRENTPEYDFFFFLIFDCTRLISEPNKPNYRELNIHSTGVHRNTIQILFENVIKNIKIDMKL